MAGSSTGFAVTALLPPLARNRLSAVWTGFSGPVAGGRNLTDGHHEVAVLYSSLDAYDRDSHIASRLNLVEIPRSRQSAESHRQATHPGASNVCALLFFPHLNHRYNSPNDKSTEL